jgi:curved DNA-binding protein
MILIYIFMDHYTILGVERSATQEEVKKAFRKLAMQHHPDQGGDNKKFAEITAAYEILSNPQKRQEYDTPKREFNFSSSNMGGDFNDLFSQFFSQTRVMRKNQDIRLAMQVTLEDVAVGKDVVGSYVLPSGRSETVNIKIPPGIENGETIRFKNLGDDAMADAQRGDLLISVKVLPHKTFVRDGTNIVLKKSIDIFDLLIGTTVVIEDLTGSSVSVNIAKGTNPGTTLSVSGRGLPDFRTGKVGNLYIQIKGVVPFIEDELLINKIKEIKNEINPST